jgi:predicted DNA binding CopG/RHH family protein
MAVKNKIPVFKNEDEERKFWSLHDTADYADWSKAMRISYPHLKPSIKTISVRLSESMINDLKILANKNDVPYQSLMKIYLSERIKQEFSKSPS